jgi:hypothetical protein
VNSYQSYEGPNRRSETRDAISVPIMVQPLDANFQPVGGPFCAVSRDVSGGGIGLIHTDPITAEYVHIRLTTRGGEELEVLGKVKHCTANGPYFQIGARFVVDWTGRQEASRN